jgi:hypothetical protein
MTDEHAIDLEAVWRALDAVRDCGALAASATFLTVHGLIAVASGPDGRSLSVDGQTVLLDDDDDEAAA